MSVRHLGAVVVGEVGESRVGHEHEHEQVNEHEHADDHDHDHDHVHEDVRGR